MVTLILQHEVKDFAEWKKVFDEDEPGRAAVGAKLMGLYTSFKNPNDVTMIFEAPDASVYDILMSDPERQRKIQKSGVISEPVVSILNKV